MVDLVKNFSVCARRTRPSAIWEIMKLTGKPGIISFAGGYPDTDLIPAKALEAIMRDIIEEYGGKALQYCGSEGEAVLKTELVKLEAKEGHEVLPENILVTTASQQALDLISKVFVDFSDPVLLELPSYVGGIQALTCYGAKMIGVPIDKDGIRTDILKRDLQKLRAFGEHYKLIYLVPDFQNPAGVTMSLKRRMEVVELARKYETLVLEDSPYRDLRFEGTPPPTLVSLDKCENVISVRSASKIIAPGLRIGWIIAHRDIIAKLEVAKQSVDLCTPRFSQQVVAEFLRRGMLAPHIANVREVYRKKRDVMLGSLAEYMPQESGITWSRPEGGLFIWVTLPSRVNTDTLIHAAIEKGNVAFVMGSAFHCNGRGRNTMRLNFSISTQEQIREGVRRLAGVIEERLTRKGSKR